jgi:FtsP/CotA-like multicopper oxidase with cupredoxin domain
MSKLRISLSVLVAVGVLAAVTTLFWPNTGVGSSFGEPLNVPEEATSVLNSSTRTFDLSLETGETVFGTGRPVSTWGINGGYLGPTLRVNKGENVLINVDNNLDEDTTMHWHGLHAPAEMDGGPHQPIVSGHMWSPQWSIDQPASTNWYHPHLHGESAAQVKMGLVGMFIVDDPAEEPLGLPSTYGVDDIPLIVHDAPDQVSQGNVVEEAIRSVFQRGRQPAVTLVNGGRETFFEVTTQAVRLRLLNATIDDHLEVSFSDGRELTVIASEGGLLPQPEALTSISLSPGERYEVVVQFETNDVSRLSLLKTNSDNQASDLSDEILEFRSSAELDPSSSIPPTLSDVETISVPENIPTRIFEMSDVAINGMEMDMMRIDQVVTAGSTEIWSIRNLDQRTLHNFHVHGVSFRVLDIDGREPPAYMATKKDTVLIPPQAEVNLFVEFPSVSNEGWPYMFHCHFLRHEGRGMMGQYLIVDQGASLDPADHVISTMAGHNH